MCLFTFSKVTSFMLTADATLKIALQAFVKACQVLQKFLKTESTCFFFRFEKMLPKVWKKVTSYNLLDDRNSPHQEMADASEDEF